MCNDKAIVSHDLNCYGVVCHYAFVLKDYNDIHVDFKRYFTN